MRVPPTIAGVTREGSRGRIRLALISASLPLVLGLSACDVRPSIPTSERPLPEPSTPPVTGMDIRALFLSGTDSPEFALSSYRGRVLVLDFWATWSDSCRAELPLLGRLSAEWKSQDVALVGMAVDRGNRAEITEAVKGLNLSYPVAWADDNVQRAFGGIRAVPTRILVDKKGQIRKQLPGILPEDLLRAEVGALLAEN